MNDLTHWGIRGMRWGIRRHRDSGGGGSSARTSSEDHITASTLKKKKVHELTNAELKTLTTRLQLEKTYRELNPDKVALGRAQLTNYFVGLAKESAKPYAQKYVSQAVKGVVDGIVS